MVKLSDEGQKEISFADKKIRDQFQMDSDAALKLIYAELQKLALPGFVQALINLAKPQIEKRVRAAAPELTVNYALNGSCENVRSISIKQSPETMTGVSKILLGPVGVSFYALEVLIGQNLQECEANHEWVKYKFDMGDYAYKLAKYKKLKKLNQLPEGSKKPVKPSMPEQPPKDGMRKIFEFDVIFGARIDASIEGVGTEFVIELERITHSMATECCEVEGVDAAPD